eukprot:1156703-Pelagomonas_calceolata.AAC.5
MSQSSTNIKALCANQTLTCFVLLFVAAELWAKTMLITHNHKARLSEAALWKPEDEPAWTFWLLAYAQDLPKSE